ncbi:OsmC family protein [Deinococcus humi]|uniref:Putative redox protein n=1 Tax=Deinococcus humi TaxID=662880 RepID=A0A7W8NGY1_9DEIO|nr:OsmC family protein [Deinococcus humi]MBB5365265.1 putative redox protein [Deinococcus humi]GGO35831.1 oxidoreductase [Deinococcus humi]
MQLQVEVCQVGVSTAEGGVRGHRVLVDRPAEKGGSDLGMMGGEYLLVALGGCFISNLLAAVRTREADIRDVQVSVTGTLEGTPARLVRADVRVRAQTLDGDQLEKLVLMADRACIVANTLRGTVELHFKSEVKGAS